MSGFERTVLKALDDVLLGQGVDYLAVHLDAALVGECCTGKAVAAQAAAMLSAISRFLSVILNSSFYCMDAVVHP